MSRTQFEFSPEFMAKYGDIVRKVLDDKWTWKTVLYWLDWRNIRKMSNIKNWLFDMLDIPYLDFENLIKERNWKNFSQDSAIIHILKYVHANVKYKSDNDEYGVAEVWQPPAITFEKKTGDCEDGALLIFVLARLAGIPHERIRFCAGNVMHPTTKKLVGHAYIIYKPEFEETIDDDTWRVIDWCWFYDFKVISMRPKIKDINMYRDTWFQVNDKKYYGKYRLR